MRRACRSRLADGDADGLDAQELLEAGAAALLAHSADADAAERAVHREVARAVDQDLARLQRTKIRKLRRPAGFTIYIYINNLLYRIIRRGRSLERRAMLKLSGAAIPSAWLLAGHGGKESAQDSNPLATASQLRWEALARRIAAAPVVQAAISEALPVYLRTGAGDPDDKAYA
jgi:hypothetical protein